MLQSLLLSWNKKGMKYCFINVNRKLDKILRTVLPDVPTSNSDSYTKERTEPKPPSV